MKIGLPAPVQRSALLRAGGFMVERSWPGPTLLAALRAEAVAALQGAQETRVDASDGEQVRGGSPRRRFLSAAGGEQQARVFRDAGLQRDLADVAGIPVRPSGLAGTYSYYTRPGDFLTIHRDVQTCDLAVITCLQDDGAQGNCGATCLWPTRLDEPLSALRANPGEGGHVVRLEPGATLILLGGVVPHAILPVAHGQQRVVSLLCYEAVGSESP